MKPSFHFSSSALALLLGTLALVGCGGATSFSNPGSSASGGAPVTPQAVPGPAVNGTVYGGHAPIVGSHVYLLQPGTGGYGTIATSILGNTGVTSANGYTISSNTSDPNIPMGWKYVTTDSGGNFSLTGAYMCTPGQPVYTYSYGGNATGGNPVTANNSGIVQLAILGNCPTTGQTNFGGGSSDQITEIYENEVSTVAAAYVFQPFTVQASTSATSSAIYVGTSGSAQALLGIENAATNAAQLYDIQGGGGQSTVYDGEGHIANYRTANYKNVGGLSVLTANIGNGVVPQATIDTLANILAACVDNTGSSSTPCSTLFTNATETGLVGGIQPTDIARAAMNIARYPAGNYSSTTSTPTNFVTNIFGIPTPTVPYTPNLGKDQPNDFTIAITYPYSSTFTGYGATNSDVEHAESIAVDANGEIWITAQAGGDGSTSPSPSADRWTPLGTLDYPNSTLTNYIFGYVSVDGGNNAWTGSADKTTGIYYAGANGAFSTTYGSGYSDAYTIVTNQTGDAFFFAQGPGTGTNSGMFEYGPLGATIPGSPFTITPTTTTTTTNTPVTLTITGATVACAPALACNFGIGTPTYTYTFPITNPAATPLVANQPVTLAMTNEAAGGGIGAGTNWQKLPAAETVHTVAGNGRSFTVTSGTDLGITNRGQGTVMYTYSTTTTTNVPGAIPAGDKVAHGAIDSEGDIWATSEMTNTIARITPTGSPAFTSFTTATRPEFPAIDGSNNAWIPIQEPAGAIYKVASSGTSTTLTGGTTNTGATLIYPFGSAVDGNGNIWVTNRCGPASGTTNYNTCVSPLTGSYSTLVEINASNNLAISPPANYLPETIYPAATTLTRVMRDPLNIAIDPSGNLWIANYDGTTTGGGAVVEIIGIAAPVVTPLSVAAGDNQLGQKP